MLIWLQFLACTALITLCGTRLSRHADVIAEKTGLGRTWIGVVLLASVTSLPELITGVSAVAIVNVPDIAAGDVLGSCMFNVMVLVLVDAMGGIRTPVSGRAHQGQILTAGAGIVLLTIVCMGLILGDRTPALGWIGGTSLVILVVYFAVMRGVFVFEKRRGSEVEVGLEEAEYENVSKSRTYMLFLVNAIFIVGAATYLPHLGEQIAEMTGLGGTFVGSIFIAFSTSLPEIVVSIAAFRIGAIDMVYGNIFGSNLFNIGILAIDDIFYTRGSLLANVTPNHIITANAAIMMTAIAVMGLIYRARSKAFVLSWDSICIALVYVSTGFLLYLTR